MRYAAFSRNPAVTENFAGTRLDRKLWPVIYGNEESSNRGFWWDNALTRVSGGNLRLGLRRDAGGSWTAGGVSMIPKPWEPGFALRYGRVEVVARVTEPLVGAGPCFLMWPADGSWDAEIDFLEVPQGRGMFTVHWGGRDGISRLFDVDLAKFHEYALEWTPRSMAVRVDGEVVGLITERIPDIPMSLGLQGHVGRPDEGWYGRPGGTGPVNADILVASVKIYDYLRG